MKMQIYPRERLPACLPLALLCGRYRELLCHQNVQLSQARLDGAGIVLKQHRVDHSSLFARKLGPAQKPSEIRTNVRKSGQFFSHLLQRPPDKTTFQQAEAKKMGRASHTVGCCLLKLEQVAPRFFQINFTIDDSASQPASHDLPSYPCVNLSPFLLCRINQFATRPWRLQLMHAQAATINRLFSPSSSVNRFTYPIQPAQQQTGRAPFFSTDEHPLSQPVLCVYVYYVRSKSVASACISWSKFFSTMQARKLVSSGVRPPVVLVDFPVHQAGHPASQLDWLIPVSLSS